MHKVGLIGYGYVGKAVANGFKDIAEIRIHDINPELKTHSLQEVCESDFVFICVPTPMKETGECDTSIVESVFGNSHALMKSAIIVIKSTVPPGTTKKLQKRYPNLTIVFNPEFLTESNFLYDFLNPDRIIIGGKDDVVMEVVDLYKLKFKDTPYYLTDSTTAELAKYVSNCFLANKVTYFNEIYDICGELGVNYNFLSAMVSKDKRIGESHTTVPGYHGRGFAGNCFVKDMSALIYFCKSKGIDCSLLESVWKKNKELRDKEKD